MVCLIRVCVQIWDHLGKSKKKKWRSIGRSFSWLGGREPDMLRKCSPGPIIGNIYLCRISKVGGGAQRPNQEIDFGFGPCVHARGLAWNFDHLLSRRLSLFPFAA